MTFPATPRSQKIVFEPQDSAERLNQSLISGGPHSFVLIEGEQGEREPDLGIDSIDQAGSASVPVRHTGRDAPLSALLSASTDITLTIRGAAW